MASDIVYGLCAVTALTCAWLLLRAYRLQKTPLLMWSGLCFVGLTVSNVVLVLDRVVYPAVNLTTPRLLTALIGMLLLLYGLIWESE